MPRPFELWAHGCLRHLAFEELISSHYTGSLGVGEKDGTGHGRMKDKTRDNAPSILVKCRGDLIKQAARRGVADVSC